MKRDRGRTWRSHVTSSTNSTTVLQEAVHERVRDMPRLRLTTAVPRDAPYSVQAVRPRFRNGFTLRLLSEDSQFTACRTLKGARQGSAVTMIRPHCRAEVIKAQNHESRTEMDTGPSSRVVARAGTSASQSPRSQGFQIDSDQAGVQSQALPAQERGV